MSNEWENKRSSQDVRYTRYIASYIKMLQKAKKSFYSDEFEDWLRQLEYGGKKLTEEEVNAISFLADCGKMEFESNALRYIKNLPTDET